MKFSRGPGPSRWPPAADRSELMSASPDRASCCTHRKHQIAQAIDDGGCAGIDDEPRLVAPQKIGQHGGGVKTRRDPWHAKHVALAAEQEVAFVNHHDRDQRHAVFVEEPSSRLSLMGEAAVDLYRRGTGEWLS